MLFTSQYESATHYDSNNEHGADLSPFWQVQQKLRVWDNPVKVELIQLFVY